jgi:hypothetical protein
MSNKNLVTFLDVAQRTIIGELDGSMDGDTIKIKNPVVVNIVPQADPITHQPNGQMALQLLPVYFREFQGEKKNPAIFTYQKSQITMINFEGGFDFRLYGQYDHIFNPPATQNAGDKGNTAPEGKPPVLKLFED